MTKDMIVKLMEEANEEAEHKGWCDNELATNEQTRKKKTEAVEVLHAEIDELEATIAQLSNEITELTQAVADSDAAVAEATKIREAEKAKNTVPKVAWVPLVSYRHLPLMPIFLVSFSVFCVPLNHIQL